MVSLPDNRFSNITVDQGDFIYLREKGTTSMTAWIVKTLVSMVKPMLVVIT
ncbi:hypothetical protein PI124_g4035 [Phytophthora idaei]|nr:hypothetical protein PI126_g4120 [Phytophthora idaei]KAG3251367.1 hypothetical protein PI124_g4035 [Phytophthora idaei]